MKQYSDIIISSLTNAQVKHVVRLRDRRCRDRCQQTIIEGFRELTQALAAGHPITALFFCPDFFLGDNEEDLLNEAVKQGSRLTETTHHVFEKISYRDRPDGLLGLGASISSSLSEINFRNAHPLLLVAEAIEKPGNLGSILRSADGACVDAVIVCDPKTDINNPNVVRASVGTLFRIPVIQTTREMTLAYLRDREIHRVATSPTSKQLYWNADFSRPVAIIVGSEQYGLDDQWLRDGEQVRIPMLGKADSLNVATAASLLIYEAIRQRQTG